MKAMPQPMPTPSAAKTRVSPSAFQRQRRPQQGTCQKPEVSDPPSPSVSETRIKSLERTGN
eukprot:3843820-Lingulodinium_polyedra.AAC.1